MIETIIFWIIVLVASIFVLVKSSNSFVENAEKLGLIFKIPNFIIGATIVAVGTSLPELISSLIAVGIGQNEYVLGNALGSSTSNVLLNLGISYLLLRQKKIFWDIFNGDAIFLVASVGLLFFTMSDGYISFIEGIIFLMAYACYAYYSLMADKKLENRRKIPRKLETETEAVLEEIKDEKPKFSWMIILILLICTVGIYLGARFTLKSVGILSGLFGFDNTSILAMTFVSIGTSLPELMVSLSCVRKKNFEIALGNIIGSNIFNVFFIVGITGIISNLMNNAIIASTEVINITLPILAFGTFMLIVSRIGKKTHHIQGGILLLFYLLFLLKSFNII